jgi:hypothetical protein
MRDVGKVSLSKPVFFLERGAKQGLHKPIRISTMRRPTVWKVVGAGGTRLPISVPGCGRRQVVAEGTGSRQSDPANSLVLI